MKCKLEAWTKIEDILEHIGNEAVRVDKLEETTADNQKSLQELKASLQNHEKQRRDFSTDIKNEITSLREWFETHDTREMNKYNEILDSLQSLTDALNNVKNDTDGNTKALMQKRIEEEKERAVRAAVEAEKAKHTGPIQEYKKRAILTAVTIVTGAVVTGIWQVTVSLMGHG
jgi:dsDNA-specific endonuclease/ATPase MutS2